MKTRHRHHSQEKTFDLNVKVATQLSYGFHTSAAVTNSNTRPATAASTAQTSQSPLYARFLERPFIAGG